MCVCVCFFAFQLFIPGAELITCPAKGGSTLMSSECLPRVRNVFPRKRLNGNATHKKKKHSEIVEIQ